MPLNSAENQLQGITEGLIQRILRKLDETPEAESLFLKWADRFSKHEPFDPALWDQLKPHIQWPI